jgi:hypothetical protein
MAVLGFTLLSFVLTERISHLFLDLPGLWSHQGQALLLDGPG